MMGGFLSSSSSLSSHHYDNWHQCYHPNHPEPQNPLHHHHRHLSRRECHSLYLALGGWALSSVPVIMLIFGDLWWSLRSRRATRRSYCHWVLNCFICWDLLDTAQANVYHNFDVFWWSLIFDLDLWWEAVVIKLFHLLRSSWHSPSQCLSPQKPQPTAGQPSIKPQIRFW